MASGVVAVRRENISSAGKQKQYIALPMGHRFSKAATNANSSADVESYGNQNRTSHSVNGTSPATTTVILPTERRSNSFNSSNIIPIPINFQIQESPTATSTTGVGAGAVATAAIVASSNNQLSDSDSSSLKSINANSLQNPQIIIKIQLTKMENGNESQASNVTAAEVIEATTIMERSNLDSTVANNGTQLVNFTLNRNFIYSDESSNEVTASGSRTAGGSSRFCSNNISNRHIQGEWKQAQSASADMLPEYCEVLDESTNNSGNSTISTPRVVKDTRQNAEHSLESSRTGTKNTGGDSVGCLNGRRKYKSASLSSSSSSTSSASTALSRRRYRDAFKRLLEPSSFKSSTKNREQIRKHSDESKTHAVLPTALPNSTSSPTDPTHSRISSNVHRQETRPQSTNSQAAANITTTTTTTATSACNNVVATSIATLGCNPSSSAGGGAPTNQVSATTTIWTPSGNDLIIPITTPQFVVVQCAPLSVVALGRIEDNAIHLTSAEISSNATNNTNTFVRQTTKLPIAHSQIDFVHYLVPDLEKIINSSFYWGKIDRYEAERLLEGKPEGTFLLRDSAQEEYLFSVTFRKYGRSLHARIEQSGHKFSFDFHDPLVHTASTVTGLLQHYKDPACVMFFEPMLTNPLHRNTTFSLQELSRAVIVSNTTYDGVNELELPMPLKQFLKEYHYKQKLRVTLIDESFYSCT